MMVEMSDYIEAYKMVILEYLAATTDAIPVHLDINHYYLSNCLNCFHHICIWFAKYFSFIYKSPSIPLIIPPVPEVSQSAIVILVSTIPSYELKVVYRSS